MQTNALNFSDFLHEVTAIKAENWVKLFGQNFCFGAKKVQKWV